MTTKHRNHRFSHWVPAVAIISIALFGANAFAGDINWRQFERTQLRFMYNSGSWHNNGWKKLIPEFEKKTGMKIIVEAYPDKAERTKSEIMLAAHDSTLDLIRVQVGHRGI